MFIANCIWYLARHPEAWEKLRHEVAALGKDAPLTFDVLRTMPYLNGVMNESESEVFFFFFFFPIANHFFYLVSLSLPDQTAARGATISACEVDSP
jgi:hypothetical protein